MKKCYSVVAPLALVVGLLCLNASRGQSPSDDTVAQGVQVAPVPALPAPGGGYGVSAPVMVRSRSEINQLVRELGDTTDEAKKAEITKKLEAAVTKAFDEDQKNREAELTKLEERLKKLRAQLDRRAKAKSDIIQLQLKVLVNEAEGLGFSGASLYEPSAGVRVYPMIGPARLELPAPAPRLP